MFARKTFAALAAIALIAAAGGAFAQSPADKAAVDEAKAAGTVGEQADGYLGFVSGSGAGALKQSVDAINAGRAQVYRDAATRNGVSPDAAAASTYETVIKGKLKAGEFYKPQGSGWVRK